LFHYKRKWACKSLCKISIFLSWIKSFKRRKIMSKIKGKNYSNKLIRKFQILFSSKKESFNTQLTLELHSVWNSFWHLQRIWYRFTSTCWMMRKKFYCITFLIWKILFPNSSFASLDLLITWIVCWLRRLNLLQIK